MVPVQIAVFGAENKASCGPPLLRVLAQQEDSDPNGQRLIDDCEDVSADRLPPAGLAALVAIVVDGGLLVAARGKGTTEAQPPPLPPPPQPERPGSDQLVERGGPALAVVVLLGAEVAGLARADHLVDRLADGLR